jgi:hypothetical protein
MFQSMAFVANRTKEECNDTILTCMSALCLTDEHADVYFSFPEERVDRVIVLVKTGNSKVYIHYLYEELFFFKVKHLHKKRGKLKIDCHLELKEVSLSCWILITTLVSSKTISFWTFIFHNVN